MKGSIPMWIWIGGGIVVGLILFTAAYSMLNQTTDALSAQKGTEPFDEIKNLAEEDLCYSSPGNQRTLSISLSESVLAIYASSSKYDNFSDSDYPNKIINEEISKGKYLCLKRKDYRLQCEELTCAVQMPYLGAVPEEQSLSAMISKLMGRHKTFSYQLEFTKNSEFISVKKV
jgi:hypothetical protein